MNEKFYVCVKMSIGIFYKYKKNSWYVKNHFYQCIFDL